MFTVAGGARKRRRAPPSRLIASNEARRYDHPERGILAVVAGAIAAAVAG